MSSSNDSKSSIRGTIIGPVIGGVFLIVSSIISGYFLIRSSEIKADSAATATAVALITQPPLPTYTAPAPLPTYTPRAIQPTYTPPGTYTLQPPLPTYTPQPPLPTYTPPATYTPQPPLPTYTPPATYTPRPTFTLVPTDTAIPASPTLAPCASGNVTGKVMSDFPGTRLCIGTGVASVVDINTKPLDVYFIELEAGREMQIQSTRGRCCPYIELQLLNPNGSMAFYTGAGNPETYFFIPALSGTYYLTVQAHDSSAYYTLLVK